MPLNLGQFPQKADATPGLMEISGDAPEDIQKWVSQIRFAKILVQWFNQLAQLVIGGQVNVKLFEPIQLPAAPGVIYTSTNMRTNLQSVVLTNLTANPRIVQMWAVPNGAAIDNAHQVLYRVIPPNATVSCPELNGAAIENNEQLQAQADLANSVSVRISGSKQRIGLSA